MWHLKDSRTNLRQMELNLRHLKLEAKTRVGYFKGLKIRLLFVNFKLCCHLFLHVFRFLNFDVVLEGDITLVISYICSSFPKKKWQPHRFCNIPLSFRSLKLVLLFLEYLYIYIYKYTHTYKVNLVILKKSLLVVIHII